MPPINVKVEPAAEFGLGSRGIRSHKLAESLGRDLPGSLCVSITSRAEGHVETLLESRTSPDGEVLYDWKVDFDLQGKAAAIKNFSIYHAANKGLHIGTTAIRNLLQASQDQTVYPVSAQHINLTAELERGAWVWAKMGWLPNENSFRRLQNKVQPKLEALEQVLPTAEKLDSQAYALFHTFLDSNISKNPALIWAMVDSGLSYDINALKNIQIIMQSPRDHERYDLLRGYLQQNRPDQANISESDIVRLDKALRFMRDLDLDGMARHGRMNTSLLLFSWERWEGSLSFNNPAQMKRLEGHLQRFEQQKAAIPSLKPPLLASGLAPTGYEGAL